jgi:hypothetical protein
MGHLAEERDQGMALGNIKQTSRFHERRRNFFPQLNDYWLHLAGCSINIRLYRYGDSKQQHVMKVMLFKGLPDSW